MSVLNGFKSRFSTTVDQTFVLTGLQMNQISDSIINHVQTIHIKGFRLQGLHLQLQLNNFVKFKLYKHLEVFHQSY